MWNESFQSTRAAFRHQSSSALSELWLRGEPAPPLRRCTHPCSTFHLGFQSMGPSAVSMWTFLAHLFTMLLCELVFAASETCGLCIGIFGAWSMGIVKCSESLPTMSSLTVDLPWTAGGRVGELPEEMPPPVPEPPSVPREGCLSSTCAGKETNSKQSGTVLTQVMLLGL